jgi:hypothetical protein
VVATPEQDPSRHRISQRAVVNLTDLGGGMTTTMISRLMLQLFDAFSYDRLGIKCRLYRGVCEMDGLEPVDGGYAIVKPGLLPPWLRGQRVQSRGRLGGADRALESAQTQ